MGCRDAGAGPSHARESNTRIQLGKKAPASVLAMVDIALAFENWIGLNPAGIHIDIHVFMKCDVVMLHRSDEVLD